MKNNDNSVATQSIIAQENAILKNFNKTLEASSVAGSQKSQTPNNSALFLYVFLKLLDAMNIRQTSVSYMAKDLQANASLQNVLNKEVGNIHYSQLPNGTPTVATINRIQLANEAKSKQIQDIQNLLLTLRQSAQVKMTNTNTAVNEVEVDASENSGWIKSLNTIFKVINQISSKQ